MTQQPRRRRGVILTPQSKQKLLGAIREFESEHNFGEKYTIEELSSQTGLDPGTVAKVLDAEEGADRRTLDRFFRTFNLELAETDYRRPPSPSVIEAGGGEGIEAPKTLESTVQSRVDWGEAVDVSIFYGRIEELETLERWILEDRCRLVALLGMGGIGKTSLAAKLGDQIQGEFEYVVWRSLRNAPLVEDILISIIRFFSNQQEVDLPQSLDGLISLLMRYLHQHRCLLVLDNVESILRGGERTGRYREGFEGYGTLVQRIGESTHTGCLILTGREKPKEIGLLEGKVRPVRSLFIGGLSQADGQKILQTEGLSGSETEQQELLSRYAGNPLAVKIAANTVQELFSGSISNFLEQGATVFGDIRDLLDEQFNRLTEQGKATMFWLAINREPISLAELREDFVPPVTPQTLLETLESLVRRSLIEKNSTGFTLQNVVMEYVTDRLIGQITEELQTKEFKLLNSYALIKATAKDYVRETQVRLILKQSLGYLSRADQQLALVDCLETLQRQPEFFSGYAAGNLLNLLCYLNVEIASYDFSHLTIRQAYLNGINLYHVNFKNSYFVSPALTHTFGIVTSVAFSSDGNFIATGTANGEIRLWQSADRHELLTYQGSTNWIQAIAFSPDGRILASGGDNQSIEIWNISTQQHLGVLQGHIAWVRGITFSPDGRVLVSSSSDRTVRLWDTNSWQCFSTLEGHSDSVEAVAFSPDGRILASSSSDRTIRLWDTNSWQCFSTLKGHTGEIRSVIFDPNGHTLASSSDDETIRLWDLNTQQCIHILQGHTQWVKGIAFSPNGQILTSGSGDRTIRFWDTNTWQCLYALKGYSNWIPSVTFSPDGTTLISGSSDQTIRLWNLNTKKCFRTLQEHAGWVEALAFSPDGQILASSSGDRTIRLWDTDTWQCFSTLGEYANTIRSVAFSPNGRILAGGSDNRTICLWDLSTQQCLHVLDEHSDWVVSVAFSPDGQILASSSGDRTIRLWDTNTWQCFHILQGHAKWAWSIAFSPDGLTLASGSDDQTIRIWNLITRQCIHVFHEHTNWVRAVAFNPDGRTLASGSNDRTIRLWDLATQKCINVFHGHTSPVRSIAFCPDGQTLASCADQTIKIWNIQTGECLVTLREPRPYEGTNITGATGFTNAQRASLIALGAVDEDMP